METVKSPIGVFWRCPFCAGRSATIALLRKSVPAFFVWIAIQMFGAWAQVSGFSNVSALAHLGGAGAGFACWLLYRDA